MADTDYDSHDVSFGGAVVRLLSDCHIQIR